MERLIFSLVTIGLLSTSIYAKTIMADENEIICNNKSDLAYFFNEMAVTTGYADRQAVFNVSRCNTVNEGTDLKILKIKPLELKNDQEHTKALLVRLPNGSTGYIAR